MHLLKQASKPVPQGRKRRKLDIFCEPKDFMVGDNSQVPAGEAGAANAEASSVNQEEVKQEVPEGQQVSESLLSG